jgi:lipopolysaccharide export system ATP-binding protein
MSDYSSNPDQASLPLRQSGSHTLQVTGLAKQFKGRKVIRDCGLTVRGGEIVGLLGPNGAGKTTLFYMVVGLIPCDLGQILLDDQDITDTPMHQRAKLGIGYLPQEPSVFRRLSVSDNILGVLELRQDLDRNARKLELEHLMDELQVSHLHDQKGISLSGGERRRVEIARALAAAPRFMLLDEPFAGVDPISVVEIQRIVRHLKSRGIGVLVTDHNVRETLGICDHAYILADGKMMAEGAPMDILANDEVREVYLGKEFQL